VASTLGSLIFLNLSEMAAEKLAAAAAAWYLKIKQYQSIKTMA
jgi:hypothetical protein